MNYTAYIRLNENKEIVRAFTEAFDTPLHTDIALEHTSNRQWTLELQDLATGVYLLRYVNGKVTAKSKATLTAEKAPIIEKYRILGRLQALDSVLPRCVEDLYFEVGKEPKQQKAKDALAEKTLLRQELANLGKSQGVAAGA